MGFRYGWGLCEFATKTIKIGAYPAGGLELLLIHEICHAVANGSHTKAWMARMESAAKHAEKLKKFRLAKQIREEVTAYDDPSLSDRAPHVYARISDVLADRPDATKHQVLNNLMHVYGTDRKEFLQYYRRFEAEFTKAKRRQQLAIANQRQFCR